MKHYKGTKDIFKMSRQTTYFDISKFSSSPPIPLYVCILMMCARVYGLHSSLPTFFIDLV